MQSAAIAPFYIFNHSAISDLGVIPETSYLFNTSLIIAGILIMIGSYLFYKYHREMKIFIIFMIAGIRTLGEGIFHLKTGEILSISALITFLFANLMPIITCWKLSGSIKYISIFLGILGLV